MLPISTRTMPSVIGILFCLLFVTAARAQDILLFGDNGLPDCAHACEDLYSAQYDCQNVVNSVACFCESSFITTKSKDWRCDEACTMESEREKVVTFLAATCGGWEGVEVEETVDSKVEDIVDRKDNGTAVPSGTNSTTTATPTTTTTTTTTTTPVAPADEQAGNEPEIPKATNWPRKNWPYFLAIFLLVAFTALAFVFAGPVRKYARHQIAKHHTHKSGEGTSPYWEASTSHLSRFSSEYPPTRHSAAPSSRGGNAAVRAPLRGGKDIERQRLYETMRPQTIGVSTPPPIRTLFATRAASESSRTHESWVQRVRRRYEEGMRFSEKGSRLAFWRRSGSEKNASSDVV